MSRTIVRCLCLTVLFWAASPGGSEPLRAQVDLLTEEAKLLSADGAAGDEFGRSVSIDGNTAVVGAPLDDDAGVSSGAAYVFVRSGTSWSQEAKLTASDAAIDAMFGTSVSVSGDTIVVGAPDLAVGASTAGAAYVFVRSGMSWSQQAKLVASDAAADDHVGVSVSVDGDTAVVGAHGPIIFGAGGAAYVFVRSGTSWSEEDKLTASDAAGSDEFGRSVSIAGQTIVVGAPQNDDAGSATGSAYVFVRRATIWNQQAKLLAGDRAANRLFGQSVCVVDDTAVVGAPGTVGFSSTAGAAYVLVRDGTTWSQQAKLQGSDSVIGDQLGLSVYITGGTVLAGAPSDDDAGLNSGSAYEFERDGTSWIELAKLVASDEAANDSFGSAVSMSSDLAVVGAPFDGDSGLLSGSAYAFDVFSIPTPPEGGVRAGIDIAGTTISALSCFVDDNDDGVLSLGETAVGVQHFTAYGNRVYYRPPAYDRNWPDLSLGDVPVAILATTNLGSEVFPDDLVYTNDVLEGAQAVANGLSLWYEEVLFEVGPASFEAVAPQGGAVAQQILYGLLRRATDPAQRISLTVLLEDLLPDLRDEINATGLLVNSLATVRSITHGQTKHYPYGWIDDTVLLTLNTGTLTIVHATDAEYSNPEAIYCDWSAVSHVPGEPVNGTFTFPVADFPVPGFISTAVFQDEAQDVWIFNWEVQMGTPTGHAPGLQISDVTVRLPGGPPIVQEYSARRLSMPKIRAIVDGVPDSFDFRQQDLIAVYVHPDVPAEFPHHEDYDHGEVLCEWIVTAVYRINLDHSDHTGGNDPKPAIVARQSFAFSEVHDDFEPSHCLQAGQVYPRTSFSLSFPDGAGPSITELAVDHRLAFAPQDSTPSMQGTDEYIAGAFKDRDNYLWWISAPISCVFRQPVPLWCNFFVFDSVPQIGTTVAPVEGELAGASAGFPGAGSNFDNIHLHKEHNFINWRSTPIVEAPGAFQGAVHLHWRWGYELGPEYGLGKRLYPDTQEWRFGIAHWSFPLNPADWEAQLKSSGATPLGGGADILRSEKVILVSCNQYPATGDTELVADRQHETLSTGYGTSLGAASSPCCQFIEFINMLGGYAALQIGVYDPLFGLPDPLCQLHLPLLNTLQTASLGSLVYNDHGALVFSPSDQGPGSSALTVSQCADVEIDPDLQGAMTPLPIIAGSRTVMFSSDTPGSFGIGQNPFITSLGYSLMQPVGSAGSLLQVDFSSPAREVRHLPVAVNHDMPTTATVEVYSGGNLIDTQQVQTIVIPGREVAEGVIRIDPGEPFDRLVIYSDDPTKELAINHFQICDSVIGPGDLDYDGDVDLDDFRVLEKCFSGPDVILGYSCTDPDLDGDGDVDCDDVKILETLFTGPYSLPDWNENGKADICERPPFRGEALFEPFTGELK